MAHDPSQIVVEIIFGRWRSQILYAGVKLGIFDALSRGAQRASHLVEAPFTETNRTLFAFAAYNAGPGNLSKIRKEAERRGLDPNRWFNHVEIVTAERIGIETTTYVRNIYKYYVAYKLTQEAQAIQRKARQQVAPSAPSH